MKAVAFYRELQRYSRAYPNATKEQLRNLAAEVVKDTMPTYNMIPRGIKQLRRMPIGAFACIYCRDVYIPNTKN